LTSSPSSHTADPSKRDNAPPGRRTGEGTATLLPYLLHFLASRPKVGPPGGIERRRWPRD
jgi:hypothetical protein